MASYYSGKRAVSYNQSWKTFSQKTLAATVAAIDLTSLQDISQMQGRQLRVLDVACGTGMLLAQLAQRLPEAELHGLDASADMLAQACQLFADHPRTHFVQASLSGAAMAGLPYEPASFDLITCTNALHYLDNPRAVLQGLQRLLTPQGQLVIEDYARRGFPFPWRPFEWLVKRVSPQYIQAYTLSEASSLCQDAGLNVVAARKISIDALWQGWVIRGRFDPAVNSST
ncbi:hypothetical protein KDW_48160 [Dictyobacter vulcani]|uniref:Methyltransferase type 12 domain-containing protein n=1 Tax=Dictyobacter vulcani TaxID=2607529 RepID=A0A5J4KMR0_9CHLR|nr:class I SAM-dependent methyltransferase [Dictyobacter vulcani]GER90654.1 hypothetical protein KDW_48160 [Dictyobacter vulcani]